MDAQRKGSTIAIVIALIIGGVVGYALHKTSNVSNSSSTITTAGSSTASSDLRATLRSDLQEHAALVLLLAKSQLTETPDASAAQGAMELNTVSIGEAVGTLYPDKKDAFLKLWRAHIGYYTEYSTGAKNNDNNAKQTVKSKLDGFTEDLSALVSSANPKIDKTDFKQSISEHDSQTLTLIDQLADKNYTAAYKSGNIAYMHMGDMADMLSAAVTLQYPDKF